MVLFKKDSFTIELNTGSNPVENWMNTRNELIELLQVANPEMIVGRSFFHVLELIRELDPDYHIARRMTE